MGHPFIAGNLDSKPIKDLLLEYKADVVEEELVDEEAEVRVCFGNVNPVFVIKLFNAYYYGFLLTLLHAARLSDRN